MKQRSVLFAVLGVGLIVATAVTPAQAAWGRGGGGWHGGGWHGGGWHGGGWHGGWHAGWRGPGWGPRWWGPGIYVAPPVVYPVPGVVIYP